MVSVVIIEDDVHIRELAVRALAAAGHVVFAEANGMAGLQSTIDNAPDVVVLDLGLPDVDGSDVLRMIRGVSQVPVIIATARDDDNEIVRLLDAGADEYVVKPYSGAELEARVRALMRRSAVVDAAKRMRVGGLTIDLSARSVELDGEVVPLNRKEFDLLACLAHGRARS